MFSKIATQSIALFPHEGVLRLICSEVWQNFFLSATKKKLLIIDMTEKEKKKIITSLVQINQNFIYFLRISLNCGGYLDFLWGRLISALNGLASPCQPPSPSLLSQKTCWKLALKLLYVFHRVIFNDDGLIEWKE